MHPEKSEPAELFIHNSQFTIVSTITKDISSFAPAIIALQWLALHWDEVRARWG